MKKFNFKSLVNYVGGIELNGNTVRFISEYSMFNAPETAHISDMKKAIKDAWDAWLVKELKNKKYVYIF